MEKFHTFNKKSVDGTLIISSKERKKQMASDKEGPVTANFNQQFRQLP
jgi:hypothetical protein